MYRVDHLLGYLSCVGSDIVRFIVCQVLLWLIVISITEQPSKMMEHHHSKST